VSQTNPSQQQSPPPPTSTTANCLLPPSFVNSYSLLNVCSYPLNPAVGEPVAEASVIKGEMQYSYDDGENYNFMDMESFENEAIPKSVVDKGSFLTEGMMAQVRESEREREREWDMVVVMVVVGSVVMDDDENDDGWFGWLWYGYDDVGDQVE